MMQQVCHELDEIPLTHSGMAGVNRGKFVLIVINLAESSRKGRCGRRNYSTTFSVTTLWIYQSKLFVIVHLI